jgi:hypothetical protein
LALFNHLNTVLIILSSMCIEAIFFVDTSLEQLAPLKDVVCVKHGWGRDLLLLQAALRLTH